MWTVSPMMQKASDSDILHFIDQFIGEHGYSPTVKEIGDGVGLSSKSSIAARLVKLRKRGAIVYADRMPRTIRRADEAS